MKFALAFILVVIAACLFTPSDACGKPCPRMLKPVSAVTAMGCQQFSNECEMQNAFSCGKLKAAAEFCIAGVCEGYKERLNQVMPCPEV